jgi:hypothetical protein
MCGTAPAKFANASATSAGSIRPGALTTTTAFMNGDLAVARAIALVNPFNMIV